MNTEATEVVLESSQPQRITRAHAIADACGLCVILPGQQPSANLLLCVRDDVVELREKDMRLGRGLWIDFTQFRPMTKGRGRALSRNQPLGKAIGSSSRTVLDATAGLGRDAALLASWGCDVTAVERSPVVFALLEDAHERALKHDSTASIMQRLRLIRDDARRILKQRPFEFEVVYIDPMFPPKRKSSALASKDIRLVRAVVGEDADAADLLREARRASQRVVVKRPTHAQPLMPDFKASYGGKLVRYDVYGA